MAIVKVPQFQRASRYVTTAGMPYANGNIHLGHLAGAHVPADINARFRRLLVGERNVMFVCGTDDHGSTSEVAARLAGQPVRTFIDETHARQRATMARYGISFADYAGTSHRDYADIHYGVAQGFFTNLYQRGLLERRTSRQWFDPKAAMFLPDRFVTGECPNTKVIRNDEPVCTNFAAYSDECDECGAQYNPPDLINPKSRASDAVPELRDTDHWYLNMWATVDQTRAWLETKQKKWRQKALSEMLDKVRPAVRFDKLHEDAYKGFKGELPKHVGKYAPGKKLLLQFGSIADMQVGQAFLASRGISAEVANEWAHRPITRDIAWGIPIPELEPGMRGKTLYVWPDSLIAPISFTMGALRKQGRDIEEYRQFWCDSKARIEQLLGIDNAFFYILMQSSLWYGQQGNPFQLPGDGDLQLSDAIVNCHLLVNGAKMSKSKGNFFTGDELLDKHGYTADQVRWYIGHINLADSPSSFHLQSEKKGEGMEGSANFLGGPLLSALERPISAANNKFGGRVPEGTLMEKVGQETERILATYAREMERANYPRLLYEIENYARVINSLFTQYKPHDDRHDEKLRRDALYSSFFVLKQLMIMLQPFVPEAMERLRKALNLPESVWSVDELGTDIPAGHPIQPVPREPSIFPPRTSSQEDASA